jgi:hypothetical protein
VGGDGRMDGRKKEGEKRFVFAEVRYLSGENFKAGSSEILW